MQRLDSRTDQVSVIESSTSYTTHDEFGQYNTNIPDHPRQQPTPNTTQEPLSQNQDKELTVVAFGIDGCSVADEQEGTGLLTLLARDEQRSCA